MEHNPEAVGSIAKTPTWGHLLKFTLPTILSMLIMSTFSIVDGIFVSRLIDPIALAPVSIVFPFLALVMSIGFMLGVGGNAMIARKIGAGMEVEGRENFSMIVVVAIIISIIITLFGILLPEFILGVLGADEFLFDMSFEYMRPLLYFMPMIVLGMVFQQFLITAGKAHYSTFTSLFAGVVSASLNLLFILVLDMGISGAALATSIAYTLPALVGLTYFSKKRSGPLYFVRPRFDFRALGRTCINGASEMVTMLAVSITSVLMNNVLMGIEGPEAVVAAGIMFGGMGIFTALFIGYSSGVAPIVSYNFGKGDTDNLKKAFSNSLIAISLLSSASAVFAFLAANLLISIYDVPMGSNIHHMALTGIRFLAGGFIFMGFNSFSSMFFTALNNGLVSSIISLFRTLVFVVIAFMVLPSLFGLNGAWAAIPSAELLGISLTVFFFIKMKNKYNYA